MSDNKSNLMNTIREAAIKHNITSYELSKHTGVSITTAQRMIDGRTKKPSRHTVNKLHNYLVSCNVLEEKTTPSITPSTPTPTDEYKKLSEESFNTFSAAYNNIMNNMSLLILEQIKRIKNHNASLEEQKTTVNELIKALNKLNNAYDIISEQNKEIERLTDLLKQNNIKH